MSTTMTVRLDDDLKERLEGLADAGDFATDDEVRSMTTKWSADAGEVAADGVEILRVFHASRRPPKRG